MTKPSITSVFCLILSSIFIFKSSNAFAYDVFEQQQLEEANRIQQEALEIQKKQLREMENQNQRLDDMRRNSSRWM